MTRGARIVIGIAALAISTGSRPAAAVEHQVFAQPNNTFEPESLTIVEGDTVTWTNNGGIHNVRADDSSFRCANGCDGQGGDGDPSSANWSFSLIFSDPEHVPYYCEVHGAAGGIGMSGTVTVLTATIFADGFESGDTSAWSTAVP